MGYADVVKKSLEVLKLNTQAMNDLAADESAVGWGFLTLALAGVATAIGTLSPLSIFLNPIFMIVGFLIGFLILHGLAKLFGGQATMSQFFGPLSNAGIVYWIMVIPIVGPMIAFIPGIWMIVVEVMLLKTVHKLTTLKAVLVVAIPLIIGFILAVFVIASFLAVLTGGFLAS